MLGLAGYVIASVFCAVLAVAWDLSFGERLVALFAPPLAFILVVTIATAIKGREWIVFYQATLGAVAAVLLGGFVIDARLWRLLDVDVLGIGVFLVFGRIGCFHVACCHGRPARRGVVYGPPHVAVGFWKRWSGRPLVPVQLVESGGSLVLVIVALVGFSATPGAAAVVCGAGYSVMRFVLELYRGDPVRPFARGLSEAQWFAIAIAIAASYLVARVRNRELFLPPHLRELDALCETPTETRRETRHGVSVTCHRLDETRIRSGSSDSRSRFRRLKTKP